MNRPARGARRCRGTGSAGRVSIVAAQRRAALVAAALAVLVGACQRATGPTTADEARALLSAAIEAQGGRAALSQLDDVRIVSQGRFKDSLPFRRTIHYRAADTWSMAIEFSGGALMRFGVAGDRCWRSDRHLSLICAPGDLAENARIAALHNARLLHRIDPAAVQPAGIVDVDGRACPAIRVADLVLAFDPVSHRLAQVRLGQRIDTLSDYREVGAVMVAAHRRLTIDGETDVDETWTEVVPGGADPEALRVPEPPRDGLIVDQTEAPRPVAWMDVDDAAPDLRAAVARLDAFVQAQGRKVSVADGVILATAGEGEGGPWRVAVGVEGDAPRTAKAEDGLHLETWPAARFVGVFHRGDPLRSEPQRAAVREVMRARGLVSLEGARWQILFPRDELERPPDERMSFVCIATRPSTGSTAATQ